MKHSIFKTAIGLGAILAATTVQGSVFGDTGFPTHDQVSLRIEATELPVFPAALIAQGIDQGAVRIMISVDDLGSLNDWLVVAYTHESLAIEAVRVLENWRFEPMLVRGQPVSCQSEIAFDFRAEGVVFSLSSSSLFDAYIRALAGEEQAYGPVRVRELDRTPTPVIADSPAYPQNLRDEGIYGSAVVEFFIDEIGTVRMPAVVEADYLVLGDLAAQAIKNWRFEVPTKNGQPVLTRARQRFDFHQPAGLATNG